MANTSTGVDTSKQKTFFFSNNAFVDAGVQGGLGAIAGSGLVLYNQYKTLKNPEKLHAKISQLEKDLVQFSKWESNKVRDKEIKILQYNLDRLKNGKYNLKTIGKGAFLVGLITFVPALIGNLVFLGGKKAYEQVKAK